MFRLILCFIGWHKWVQYKKFGHRQQVRHERLCESCRIKQRLSLAFNKGKVTEKWEYIS